MDCSTPGLPVHHQLPEFTQTHVYWVSDAIQPSHPLSSPPPPTFNLSQHQGLFKWVSSSHQVAKVLELGLKHTRWEMELCSKLSPISCLMWPALPFHYKLLEPGAWIFSALSSQPPWRARNAVHRRRSVKVWVTVIFISCCLSTILWAFLIDFRNENLKILFILK